MKRIALLLFIVALGILMLTSINYAGQNTGGDGAVDGADADGAVDADGDGGAIKGADADGADGAVDGADADGAVGESEIRLNDFCLFIQGGKTQVDSFISHVSRSRFS